MTWQVTSVSKHAKVSAPRRQIFRDNAGNYPTVGLRPAVRKHPATLAGS